MRRIVTHREQVEMLAPWRVATQTPPEGLRFEKQPGIAKVHALIGDKPVASLEWHTHNPEQDYGNWQALQGPSARQHYEQNPEQAKQDYVEFRTAYPPNPHGEIQMIKTHPAYRRQGIGTALFNWAKENVEPELHHSTSQTPAGRAWGKSMGWQPKKWDKQPVRDWSAGGQQEWMP